MSERPIIFSGESVRAILAGRKTQTRRVVTVPWTRRTRTTPYSPYYEDVDGVLMEMDEAGHYHPLVEVMTSPFGRPGDRLWVREEFSGPYLYHAERKPPRAWSPNAPIHYWADGAPLSGDWTPPRPAMYMPRRASRLTLEVVSVRVERLQEMDGRDAQAEGYQMTPVPGCGENDWWCHGTCRRHGECQYRSHPLVNFREAWDALNAKRGHGWDENPWVWVVGFKRTEDER